MKNVCIYFQVHQPYRLKKYSFFDIGKSEDYFDNDLNEQVVNKVSDKCYLPANQMFLDLIREFDFKVTYSLSGVFLEQIQKYRPDVLLSFQELVNTGNVEILAETYHHSLAFLYDKNEFDRQVELHEETVLKYFGVKPTSFRNTELIYSNQLAAYLEGRGYASVLTESIDELMTKNTQFYKSKEVGLSVLTRNYKLTDDVAFRFSDPKSKNYPLTGKKYLELIGEEKSDIINLFMDYETIGEHHWEDTGIFDFWKEFVAESKEKVRFKMVSEVCSEFKPELVYDAPEFISWADTERDLSAWNGNHMQKEALARLKELLPKVIKDPEWAKLQTSDHFYYMSTKHMSDGAVHNYFSPFDTPYDAYIYFMNVMADRELRK